MNACIFAVSSTCDIYVVCYRKMKEEKTLFLRKKQSNIMGRLWNSVGPLVTSRMSLTIRFSNTCESGFLSCSLSAIC